MGSPVYLFMLAASVVSVAFLNASAIALRKSEDGHAADWMEHVSDEQYASATLQNGVVIG